jgi:hypothetical protein
MWLVVPPVPSLGLKLDPLEFVTLLRWWLGLPVLAEAQCPEPKCRAAMDPLGDHAVKCPCGPSRIARHDLVNHTWSKACQAAGYLTRKEVMVDPNSQRRSADTLVESWEHGRSCAHDWVVTHTLKKSALEPRVPKANAALDEAEAHKVSYARARCEERGVAFLALAADTFGGFGEQAVSAISQVARESKLRRGPDEGTTASRLRQRLQVAVLRGVARQLLPHVDWEEELPEEAC